MLGERRKVKEKMPGTLIKDTGSVRGHHQLYRWCSQCSNMLLDMLLHKPNGVLRLPKTAAAILITCIFNLANFTRHGPMGLMFYFTCCFFLFFPFTCTLCIHVCVCLCVCFRHPNCVLWRSAVYDTVVDVTSCHRLLAYQNDRAPAPMDDKFVQTSHLSIPFSGLVWAKTTCSTGKKSIQTPPTGSQKIVPIWVLRSRHTFESNRFSLSRVSLSSRRRPTILCIWVQRANNHLPRENRKWRLKKNTPMYRSIN